MPESDCITSFYLKPVDGSQLTRHLPGQYLTVRVPDSQGATTMRNYSISARPGASHYRISVKREGPLVSGGPAGYVSNYLHSQVEEGDRIEIAPPCGEFVLDVADARQHSRPLVLLSGGVGITPVLSMLYAAAGASLDRDVYFVHGAISGSLHAFGDEARQLAASNDRIHTHFCYSQPREEDLSKRRCDTCGLITVALLKEVLPTLDCDYYLCGPKPFMGGL